MTLFFLQLSPLCAEVQLERSDENDSIVWGIGGYAVYRSVVCACVCVHVQTETLQQKLTELKLRSAHRRGIFKNPSLN